MRSGEVTAVRGVSIPIGFSNELQHYFKEADIADATAFQSLSGFPMSCNFRVSAYHGGISDKFQSLSGFPMSCNERHVPG